MIRRRSFALTLMAVFASTLFVGHALAIGPYLGSGQFPTSYITWYGEEVDYAFNNPRDNAIALWNNNTDLTIVRSNDWKVFIGGLYQGDTGLAGKALICNTDGACDNSLAWSSTYRNCNIYINRTYYDRYTESQRWNVHGHELGHCWSLAHDSEYSSIMYPSTTSWWTPNSDDYASVNARY
jgi:predicted Zn-dependent protease